MTEPARLGILDIGCGPNKVAGAFGIDHHPYPGVDAVCDLDAEHWDLPADSFHDLLFAEILSCHADFGEE